MSPSEIEQLFKPFSQADASTTRMYGGTGLGLSICRRLTELMDGDISVTSREHKGSSFRVRVWIALGDPVNLPESASSESTASKSLPACYRNAHVLVVEDHPLNREIAKKLLNVVGITSTMATNGQEAVDILSIVGPNHFDLVLMDVQMPVMDGLTATREIRTRKDFTEVPIVGMTAHIMEHEKQISTAAGMNDHIGKPFDTGFFYHILAKWIPESKRQELPRSDVAVTLRADVGLSALHGIDTEGALERFVGNEQRYRHWLIKFAADSSGDLIDIRNALARGELEVVRKSAHCIKGQAGMLGLTDLHTIASAIETAVANGQPSEHLLVSMEQEGKRVCSEIASTLGLVAQVDHADQTLVRTGDTHE
jgi:CheY-like chemotaxis protein/HPt (histidine-containing phosphotransfer) domain-containing protein